MKGLLRPLKWLVAVIVFFLLFAFALNNQAKVQVHMVFGWSGQTPLVLVILLAFAVGMVTGVLGMLPHWWQLRRKASSDLMPMSPEVATRSVAVRPGPSSASNPNAAVEFDYGP